FGRSADGNPQATTYAIIKSLDWAYRRGARLFNLSFAGPPDKMLIRALNALADHGTIMVAAAGNAGPEEPPAWPAAHPGVIAVTATDQSDGLYAFANRGSYVFIAAPGVDILTTAPGGKYELVSGTSIAAAHVTGVIALMLERNPELDAAMVSQLLLKSSVDLGPAGMDTQFGAGLIDAFSAVRFGEAMAGRSGTLRASD
ncbi:MAG TPA: S8 family serine peptidase, partial [Afifellaceae bacterium]|nr:S8 family serine peptidase [Afifellaceae bacterium]